MLSNIQPVHAARQVKDAPIIAIQPGCGFGGDQTIVIQAMVNYWEGKVTGITLNAAGKWHRIEVTRMCSLADYQDERLGGERDTILRTKCGKKAVDRALRPDNRFTLTLPLAGPYGIGKINMVPWTSAIRDITDALKWAIDAANTEKLQAFGLIAVVDITEPIWQSHARFGRWQEAEIIGIRAVEVLRLDSPSIPAEVKAATPKPNAPAPGRRIAAASYDEE